MSLPDEWRRWRSNRRRELIDHGMPNDVAASMAAWEAKGRLRVAETVGTVAAMRAELSLLEGGPTPRFAIVGGWDLIPAEKRAAVEAATASAGQTKH